jgi:hypothetical protein
MSVMAGTYCLELGLFQDDVFGAAVDAPPSVNVPYRVTVGHT